MPGLETDLHLRMLKEAKNTGQLHINGLYGLQWGDPQRKKSHRYIRDNYLLRYVHPDHMAVEIGPGGGRWTRYMLLFHKLYVIDYHHELLEELQQNFRSPFMTCIKNNGTDFPHIFDHSIDFVFSYAVFVHLDQEIIDSYLKNIRRIVKPTANIVIHYSDKRKPLARENISFSNNSPEEMRALVQANHYRILEEDTELLPHSSIIRFCST